jgi:hypothetical protein
MSEKMQSAEGADDARAPYEAPAIEQSAGFERLMLGCMFNDLEDPVCPLPHFSAPM